MAKSMEQRSPLSTWNAAGSTQNINVPARNADIPPMSIVGLGTVRVVAIGCLKYGVPSAITTITTTWLTPSRSPPTGQRWEQSSIMRHCLLNYMNYMTKKHDTWRSKSGIHRSCTNVWSDVRDIGWMLLTTIPATTTVKGNNDYLGNKHKMRKTDSSRLASAVTVVSRAITTSPLPPPCTSIPTCWDGKD